MDGYKSDEIEFNSYRKYFQEDVKYQFMKQIILIVAIISDIILMIKLRANLVILIPVCIVTLLYLIVTRFRLLDERKVAESNFIKAQATIEVDKIEGKEVNGKYCTMYSNVAFSKMQKSKKYYIEYADRTYGKYVIYMEEIKDVSE